jgi:hypothetical protein
MVFAKGGGAGHVYAIFVTVTSTLSQGDFKPDFNASAFATPNPQTRTLTAQNDRSSLSPHFGVNRIITSCIARFID